MLQKGLKERKDVDKSLTWDLSHIYKNDGEYNSAVNEMIESALEIEKKYKGRLNSSKIINECIHMLKKVHEIMNLAYSYSSLPVAVDQNNQEAQERENKFINIMSDLESRLSFIESEIIECNLEIIENAIKESKENANYLNDIKRNKEHTLHPEVEKVLSAMSATLDSPSVIYNQAKLADMQFNNFEADGKEYPLSFALYENDWEYENNTKIRRAAFDSFSSKLREYQNTIAAVYQTQIQKEKTITSLRGFSSVFDGLLFYQKIDRELFDRQIDIIMEKLAPHMRKYAKLLQRIHKIDEMTFADLKIAVDPDYEPRVSIEESKKYIEGALSVLGEDYLNVVKTQYDKRGIDFVQNKGKSTGAFCATPYGKQSFILMTWTGRMSDVFTIAHELGHAGHFHLSHKYQNILDIEPSLYFVEAPSTMHELFLANYLLKANDEPRFKRWVLSSIIGNTYYHNFVTHLLEAAYQREVYKIIDEGGSVHASKLCEIKKTVLEKFWGDAVKINSGAELTWMRQPHYYMGLYPYTYSAGLTIATEVSRRILNEGQKAINEWIEVLKAGGTKAPVELAKMAGVDITTEQPLLNTIEYIGSIIDEIIKLS
jgi:oligoendopeptidase F